jgi:hypothetical protein
MMEKKWLVKKITYTLHDMKHNTAGVLGMDTPNPLKVEAK